MNQAMTTITRLRQAREDAGFKTAAEFANKFGFTESLVRSNENGHRPLTIVQAKRYAKVLGVSWLWLMEEAEPSGTINAQLSPSLSVQKKVFPRTKVSVTNDSPDQLRVLGMAEGGADGWNTLNGEVVEYIGRPDGLLGVPNAYAVYVRGTSMSPRYEAGDKVYIHPGKPVLPGHYVLVQKHNPGDPGHPLAIIKKLVKRAGGKVTLAQLNPKKEFSLLVGDVVSIHRVIGHEEA